jgi:hypothetical protein
MLGNFLAVTCSPNILLIDEKAVSAIHPIHQLHQNPRVIGHVLLAIRYRNTSQSYYTVTIGKLNAKWSNKYHLQHSKSCNKAVDYAVIGVNYW